MESKIQPQNSTRINWPLRILDFLRLRDAHDGTLSLTNIGVIITLFKLAWLKGVTLPDLTALMGCLGLYHLKRVAGAKAKQAIAAEGDVAKAKADSANALAQVTQARDELKTHTDKLRLMLDTVAMGRR